MDPIRSPNRLHIFAANSCSKIIGSQPRYSLSYLFLLETDMFFIIKCTDLNVQVLNFCLLIFVKPSRRFWISRASSPFIFASANFDGVPHRDHDTRGLRRKWPLWTFTVWGSLPQCRDARPKGTPFCPLVARQRLH